MSYVDDNLLPGEHVAYRAHLHPLIYAGPLFLALAAVALIVFGLMVEGMWWAVWLGGLLGLVALIAGIVSLIHSRSSEFAVTNRRVVIKVGVIRRHTVELLLQQIEGIGVDQTIFGRMLDLGSISIIGTGGTKEVFKNIADPLEFRHQVQAQTAGIYDAAPRGPMTAAPIATAGGGAYCSACGTQSPPAASFCFRCGQRLATS